MNQAPMHHVWSGAENLGNRYGRLKLFSYLCAEPRKGISFPIFIRKETETRKLERKSKQKISRLNDLLYRLNDVISR